MPLIKHLDDILNINVSGKKYTVRRSDLMADPRSKLADWFRPNNNRPLVTDKGGNIFLNRDPKSFRQILFYLRLKKERFVPSLALPSKPDELAKSKREDNTNVNLEFRLVAECEALNLAELKECALEMLQKYQRTDEQHYVTSYVQSAMKDYEAWQFETEKNTKQPSRSISPQNEFLSSAYQEFVNSSFIRNTD